MNVSHVPNVSVTSAMPPGPRVSLQAYAVTRSVVLLDDERVIHETTPIQPAGGPGNRDTLVITCRAGGFQGA